MRKFFIFSVLAICGYLIYSDTFHSSFHFDDFSNIVNYPAVHWEEISAGNFRKLFDWESSGRPFSLLTFALNYYYGGLNVTGYHYVNIGLHILTAFGFFLFLESTLTLPRFRVAFGGREHWIAFLAALLWLASPLQTQAVTYIVQRMASLAAMFYVYSMFFYLRGRLCLGSKRYLFYFLSSLSAILAFASKENSYILPLYILLFEVIIIRGGDARFLLGKKTIIRISIFATLFAGIIFYLNYWPLQAEIGAWFVYMIKARFLTGLRVMVLYVFQLLLPVPARLSFEHDFQVSRSLFDPSYTIIPVLFVSGFFAHTLFSFRKRPLFSFFSLWFIGNLAIETFYPFLAIVYEHRLYLPSMGFFSLAAVGFSNLLAALKDVRAKLFAVAAVIIIVASFSINTYIRNEVWKDEYTLWNDVIKKNPNLAKGYMGLGITYIKDGDNHSALGNYEKAKLLEPRNPIVRYELGVINFNLKRYEESIKEFSYLGSMGYIGIDEGPTMSHYLSRIARTYYGHGRKEAALDVLSTALKYDPNEPSLIEIRKKMEEDSITYEELMRK